ncbi:MAG: hypothetical protein ACK5NK_10605 [Niabella sp.]
MTGRHFYIRLGSEDNYYASCNILNDEGLIYVYLLHPHIGSFTFTMYFDERECKYLPRFIVPGLRKNDIVLINEAVFTTSSDEPVTSDNYRLAITGEEYGYIVVNRMFEKLNGTTFPSGKFNIFYEDWNSYGEYLWSSENGLYIKVGDPPPDRTKVLIMQTIADMEK